LDTSSLKLAPQCHQTDELTLQEQIYQLYSKLFEGFKKSLTSLYSIKHEVSDSILTAYKRVFQASKACQNVKLMLGNLPNGDCGYVLQQKNDSVETTDEMSEDALLNDTSIECHLECITFRKCAAIPINPNEKQILIEGVNNRRCALEGAKVKVRVYKNSNRCGRVCEIVRQGPQRQFVCHVDSYNSLFFFPIDNKTPKLVNLPSLSRESVMQATNYLIIKEELKYKQRVVTVFDPESFCIPRKPDEKIYIPQIKDVIPLSIAQNLLFVVWYLRWKPKYRNPLGVVIAAIPKGLTLYHGEQLLLAHHNINTDDLDDDETITVPTTTSSLPYYENAFTIDSPEAMALDDALTLEPVASDDGKFYQLGVHIANVGRAVRKESKADDKAKEKGTAVYSSKLSSKSFPILSKKVRDALSLDYGKNSLAISFTCQVHIVDDNHARVVPNTINICESHVQSKAQLTYEEVQHSFTKVKDELLDEKITKYNEALSINKAFGLEQRLALLLQISESFFRIRVKSDDINYSIEGIDQLQSPQAYFLVEELMVWANRIAAKCTLTVFPQVALLRRQKPPEQDQLLKTVNKYKDIVAHFPVHKTIADHMGIATEPESLQRQLYEALQSDNLLQAKNLLRITNYHPQLAVLCEEVNSTKFQAEYICSSMLQKQKPLLPENKDYLVSLHQDENKVYGHDDLCCLYTHSTSPLTRYADIVVQRLILQHLSPPTSNTGLRYSDEELDNICRYCSIQEWNARKFEREFDCLNVALSLAQCSQYCTAYIASIEKSLNFVILDLDYKSLSKKQRSFDFSRITSNATKPEEHNKSKCFKTYVWKTKVTSFNSKLTVNENFRKCHLGDMFAQSQDLRVTFYSTERADESVNESNPTKTKDSISALVQHYYMADFPTTLISLCLKNWKKVTDFMKLPSQDTAAPLKILLGNNQSNSGNDTASIFPENASFFLYEVKRSFKEYETFKVSYAANYNGHILSPCIQLLEVAPMLNVCVQHSTKPADCFSSPILSHASKMEYDDIHEYIELWESVLLAEAAVQSVAKAEIQLIQNVPLKWPRLQLPRSSLDDVYYSPSFKENTVKEEFDDVTLTIPANFEKRCGKYFDIQVGNLVCARYSVPLDEKKEVAGRKVTTASAVYHFIIHHIEAPGGDRTQTITNTQKERSKKPTTKKSTSAKQENDKVIHLKFASKDTARVSPFMKQYLNDSTCEIQVISLDLPYR